MKYYLYSAGLIILAIIIATITPLLTDSIDTFFVSLQIPQNNASVAGIQKYNIPPLNRNLPVPSLSARAILVKDLATDTVLYEKQANIPLPVASTTKIMTALVASEYFQPNSVLTVRDSAGIIGAKVGLFKGENLSFRSLLYGMLLSSGNDAAYTIAENFPGGVLGFISAMNQKANELNLTNSHFDNPAGFDNPKHFSSARDLSIITQEALKNSQLTRIFATKETSIVSLDKKYNHQLHNLNKLLSEVGGVLGVKTGYTPASKENLITLVDRGGHQVLTLVLGSDDRFGETTKLIEWTYSNFIWQEIEIVR